MPFSKRIVIGPGDQKIRGAFKGYSPGEGRTSRNVWRRERGEKGIRVTGARRGRETRENESSAVKTWKKCEDWAAGGENALKKKTDEKHESNGSKKRGGDGPSQEGDSDSFQTEEGVQLGCSRRRVSKKKNKIIERGGKRETALLGKRIWVFRLKGRGGRKGDRYFFRKISWAPRCFSGKKEDPSSWGTTARDREKKKGQLAITAQREKM